MMAGFAGNPLSVARGRVSQGCTRCYPRKNVAFSVCLYILLICNAPNSGTSRLRLPSVKLNENFVLLHCSRRSQVNILQNNVFTYSHLDFLFARTMHVWLRCRKVDRTQFKRKLCGKGDHTLNVVSVLMQCGAAVCVFTATTT